MKKLMTFLFSLLLFAGHTLAQNDAMILIYDTSLSEGTTISLPFRGTVDVTVDWGDGSTNHYTSTTGISNHEYSTDGIYMVKVSGTATAFGTKMSQTDPRAQKLIKVISFGDLGITGFAYAFYGNENLTEVPNTLPSSVTNMEYMFNRCSKFNSNISNWDVSNVTNMESMFYRASVFNQDIGNWDVSNVTNMASMFCRAPVFNQDISNWDVSKVTNMEYMFAFASAFNQPIGNWNTSSVTNMSQMFFYASAFNQPIGNWNVSNVTNMNFMFESALVFNQDIGSWDVNNVTQMMRMFFSAKNFNQDIGNWDVSNVTNMKAMFYSSFNFNQDIGNWNVGKVTDMSSMFNMCRNFNQDIGRWDVSNVTDMDAMFSNGSAFDQDISNWNVSNVTSMYYMFTHYSSLSAVNYNRVLEKWSQLNLQNGVIFTAGVSKYSPGAPAVARQKMIDDFGWKIHDGGMSNLPVVLTTAVTGTTHNSAEVEANITNSGGETITARGVVWGTDTEPTLENNTGSSSAGAGLGVFTVNISDLSSNTVYFVRAYAININGTVYGNEIKFTTLDNLTPVSNNDANTISLYPNPFSSYIYIGGEEAVDAVSIYHISGQKVLQKQLHGEKQIDVRHLPEGIYLISLQQADGREQTTRMIK